MKILIEIFFSHSRMDQFRLNITKYSFSQRTVNDCNKLSTYGVTASSMNMFKNKVDTYLRNVGLSISQWLPCPFAIWAFALDSNLVKSY